MDDLLDAIGAIGGLAFGSIIILLMAPILDPMVPVGLTGLGVLLFFGAIALTIVLLIALTRSIISVR